MSNPDNRVTEPTIDEMLAWVNATHKVNEGYASPSAGGANWILSGIRAILEQHRDTHPIAGIRGSLKKHNLEAIRAFVDRVNNRADEENEGYQDAMRLELAAMEYTAND